MVGCGDFSLGHDVWPGLGKLIEEMGEVHQVCGKLIGSAGASDHWDGTNLRDRLTQELADVMAAIQFVIEENDIDQAVLFSRTQAKLDLFRRWHDGDA